MLKEIDVERSRDNLGMQLLPLHSEDAQQADNQVFSNVLHSANQTQRIERVKILSKPLLAKHSSERSHIQDVCNISFNTAIVFSIYRECFDPRFF